MYLDMFSKKRILTTDLRRREVYMWLLCNGYVWIRRFNPPFQSALRTPTIGCWVDVLREWDTDCVPINSREGRKLIRRLCYF
jgi:hypothetical protein